jgi:predicted nucleic acid-binding protein
VSGYLLDTNVISEVTHAKPDVRVENWLDSVEESELHLSVLTLGGIWKGLNLLPRSKKQAHLRTWFDRDLASRFAGRILPIDGSIAVRWGMITANAYRNGAPLPVIDGLLAATALQHDLILVTRNVADFSAVQIELLNPWRP